MRLHVEVAGPVDAPAVVLGSSLGTSSAWMWREQVEVLARDHRVVAYDTRGNGSSPAPPGPYRIEELADDVLDTLDELGVGAFDAVGLSLGGAVSLQLALSASERVRRLVLACTSACFVADGSPQPWHDRAAAVRADGTGSIAEAIAGTRWLSPATLERRRDVYEQGVAEISASPDEGYAACCELLAGLDLRDRLGEVVAPTLVVAGELDQVTPVEPHLATLARGIAGARLEVVPGGSHLANLDRPELVADLLRQFLTNATEG